MTIFLLYDGKTFVKSFAHLTQAVSYMYSNKNDKYELFVEEYDDDIEKNGMKTLLYKDSLFLIKNIFDYY